VELNRTAKTVLTIICAEREREREKEKRKALVRKLKVDPKP
jgi:hypothetical protein